VKELDAVDSRFYAAAELVGILKLFMAKRVFLVLVLLVAAGGLIFAYLQMSKERLLEAGSDKPVAADSRVKSGAHGEAVLVMDQETQTRIALKTGPVAAATLTPEAQGYGRVLDPAPLAALSAELASAEAALAASQKEFDRLKLLSVEKNASERALQAAEAAARHDQILLDSIRLRLVSGWGKDIAERPDLAELLRSLATLESALVRVDLPAGEALNGVEVLAQGARVALPPTGKTSVSAQWLGPAPNVDPQVQGQGFLFLAKAGTGNLVPGMAVVAYLPRQREPLNGFLIPDSAVVRQAGQAWVYVQMGNDTFTRRKISLDYPRDHHWFVTEGVGAADRIVIQGAQTLLSEELKDQIRMLN
jgi:hypothetical protein